MQVTDNQKPSTSRKSARRQGLQGSCFKAKKPIHEDVGGWTLKKGKPLYPKKGMGLRPWILLAGRSRFQGYYGNTILGGGFKYSLFSPLPGEMIEFDWYFSNGLKPPTRYVSDDLLFLKLRAPGNSWLEDYFSSGMSYFQCRFVSAGSVNDWFSNIPWYTTTGRRYLVLRGYPVYAGEGTGCNSWANSHEKSP